MSTTATSDETPAIELWDRQTVLKFFGGDLRPLHVSTLYRGIEAGRYPKPIHVSANLVRWVRSECEAARERMLDERDRPETRRGRPRLHPVT